MTDESNKVIAEDRAAALDRFAKKLFVTYGTHVLAGLLAYGTLYGIFSWSVNRYLDERDAVLKRIDASVANYRQDTIQQFDTIVIDVRRVADSVSQVNESVADIRERIAKIEAQGEVATNALSTLTSVQSPGVDWEFIPLTSYAPEPFVGGNDYLEVPGFDKMMSVISIPRTIDERSRAVERLVEAHRRSAIAQGRPVFNADEYDFEVSVSQILQPNGNLALQLTSRVVASQSPE